jgi:diacylglycerol kinase
MLKYFLRSLAFALKGVASFFSTEKNGRLQGMIAVLVIMISAFFHISKVEWILVITSIIAVISFEMINSAIERLCNLYTKEFHPDIKFIKDVSAASVLLIAIAAAITGIIIFLPYIKAIIA